MSTAKIIAFICILLYIHLIRLENKNINRLYMSSEKSRKECYNDNKEVNKERIIEDNINVRYDNYIKKYFCIECKKEDNLVNKSNKKKVYRYELEDY